MNKRLRGSPIRRSTQVVLLFSIPFLFLCCLVAASRGFATPVRLDVPYVPTPHQVVEKMLEMADVQPTDFLIDLGSGDGRIAIAAVRDRGARGAYGVDLNPERVAEARANADAEGVADRVTFEQGDLFETDLSGASVISMYLLPSVNMRLRPHLLELPPGTRIVSHAFDMEDWAPDGFEEVGNLDVYLWIIPEHVAGRWLLSTPDGDVELSLSQQFQQLAGQANGVEAGQANASGQAGHNGPATVTGALRGDVIQFDVDDGSSTRRFVGRVHGDTISALPHAGAQEGWTARRFD